MVVTPTRATGASRWGSPDPADPVGGVGQQRPVGDVVQAAGQRLGRRPQVDQEAGLLQRRAVLRREHRPTTDGDDPARRRDGEVDRADLAAPEALLTLAAEDLGDLVARGPLDQRVGVHELATERASHQPAAGGLAGPHEADHHGGWQYRAHRSWYLPRLGGPEGAA